MKIAVVFAMEEEKDAFFKHFDAIEAIKKDGLLYYRLSHKTHVIHCMQSGIGKVNAAYRTALFLRENPYDILINTGIAGGVDTDLLSLVLAKTLVYHDVDVTAFGYPHGVIPEYPAAYETDASLLGTFRRTFEDTPYLEGTVASGDQFMTSVAPLQKTLERHPDLKAVDMESTAIAQVAYRENIPFLAFRIISDVLGSPTQVSDEASVEKATLKSGEALRRFIDAL